MKSLFKSKIIWFNAVTVLVGVATFFGYVPNQEVANKTTDTLFLLAPFVNILLRLYTKKPVSVTGK